MNGDVDNSAAPDERFTEALEELAKCEALAPMLPQLFMVRARIRLARSELELALADCKQAIQLSPTEPMVWVLRGRYYLQTNELPLARQDFRQALRLDPENEEAASLLSLIDAGASELKQAP